MSVNVKGIADDFAAKIANAPEIRIYSGKNSNANFERNLRACSTFSRH